MPLRGLLHALGAPTDLVPRDAVAGTGPAVLEIPGGVKLATVISWEVFFGGRVNEGVEAGGDAIINPTNGSSYTWTVLQSQQIASSRLRAIEQNRWVVQVAPTGFSAFISPDGEVHDRTAVSEQKVITRTIELHNGIRTWYSHTGDIPWVVLFGLVLALSLFRARRTSPQLYAKAVRPADTGGGVSPPEPESASEAAPH
jgi:apolipoprotein N-acyltransferase